VARIGSPGEALNWLLRHACVGAIFLGLAAAVRDPERAPAGLLGSFLGVVGLFAWAVVRLLERLLGAV
jgi:hypothetical protein